MLDWLESVAPGYGLALMWTVVALIGLLVLLIIIRIVRGLTFGTFVSGGRNRKARLAVMDATAVDSQRRLVLVRRDDVEHLILIGGPSDVVVEQNIKLLPPARRPVQEDMTDYAPPPIAPVVPTAPAPRAAPPAPPETRLVEPAPRPAPVQVERQPSFVAPAPEPEEPPAQPMRRQEAPTIIPQRAAPVQPPQPVAPPPPVVSSPPVHAQPVQSARETPAMVVPVAAAATVAAPSFTPEPVRRDLDDALFEELEVSLETEQQKQAVLTPSLDEEMDRLLSDLAGERR